MLNKIKTQCMLKPNAIAYKNNNNCISYKELWDKANIYSDYLKKQGNEPVIIYGDKEVNFIITILACLLANRTYIPINIKTPINRINNIIDMTNASLIISDYNIDISNIAICKLEDTIKYNDEPLKEIDNDIVYIIFTSGSTGNPKGVPISKDNLNNFINWISNIYPLSIYQNINVLNQASFSFDLSVADLYYSLCNGHTLVALEGNILTDYSKIYDIFFKDSINVAVMTPSLMKLCLLNKEFNERNYPNFKCVYFCGERLETKIAIKLLEAFPSLNVINAYGPTEATSAISSILITKDIIEKNEILPVGIIEDSACNIEIIDDEIVLKGKSVFNGYIGGITGGYYDEHGINCYKTGDIGYIKDNYLYCKGRKDNQIKYKGYRIELDEIELNILKLSEVKDCCVVAKYNNENIVNNIKAFVITNRKISVEEIKDELNKLLPEYMIPRIIKIVDELPLNSNGKIDRKALSNL